MGVVCPQGDGDARRVVHVSRALPAEARAADAELRAMQGANGRGEGTHEVAEDAPGSPVSDEGTKKRSRCLTFTVEGKPTAYVRMTRRSQHEARAIAYTAYRERVGWTARQAGAEVMAGSLALSVHAMVTERRWDLDNLVKGISDALNGVCWTDDKQITRIDAYLEVGWIMDRVEVTVRVL
jgi:crossover junction endodeoxyribonuclease RusA